MFLRTDKRTTGERTVKKKKSNSSLQQRGYSWTERRTRKLPNLMSDLMRVKDVGEEVKTVCVTYPVRILLVGGDT